MDHGRRINALTYLLALVCCLIMAQSALSAVQIGQRVGEFQLEDASGKTHSPESYLSSGKVVVLCFWSFKCPVSLAYNRRLAALQEKYRPRGVAVLGIASNANESPAEIERNTANLNLPFPVLIDKDGAWRHAHPADIRHRSFRCFALSGRAGQQQRGRREWAHCLRGRGVGSRPLGAFCRAARNQSLRLQPQAQSILGALPGGPAPPLRREESRRGSHQSKILGRLAPALGPRGTPNEQ